MNGSTREPAFWIVFAVISALSGVFAWRYFPAALPLINLDVKMTRGEALARAAAIADHLDLAPAGAQRAVVFSHDGATQNFVELEAGGKPAFTQMLNGALYSPYWWEVRLFKPGETAEARVRFRPMARLRITRKVPESPPLRSPRCGARNRRKSARPTRIDLRLTSRSAIAAAWPNGIDHVRHEREREAGRRPLSDAPRRSRGPAGRSHVRFASPGF
jgi:hypothetical protein